MGVIIMAGQLILALSILVGLHELGHLVAAKAFGMRVEKYSIGFPPKIWGFQYGETEYSLGAIPLGGFVKISGMIDESLDTKQLNEEPEPWEFRAKPAWQRLIVMLGGIIVNVITGMIIFIALTFFVGENYISKDEVNKHGIVAYPLGKEIGFETGDKILKVNGEDFERFSKITSPEVLLSDNGSYTIERAGKQMEIKIPKEFLDKFTDNREGYISYRFEFEVGRIGKDTPAEKSDLKVGDKIIAYNGQSFKYFDELRELLMSSKETTVNLKVIRDGEELNIVSGVTEDRTIGFNPSALIETSHVDFSFGESLTRGSGRAFEVVWTNIKAFKKIFKGEVSASKSLSGPIGIARIFGNDFDWAKFWSITGLLSMVLAFMNLLPIPALDGGHVVFLTYEIVSGKKPSDKFLENAQKVGMILLLGLMVFAFGNDIYKEVIRYFSE